MASSAAAGIIISAPTTGAGKTLFTVGLIRALSRQGIKVAPVKIGPDFIDPRFHEIAAGRPCLNIDGWAMRPDLVASLLCEASKKCDVIIAEGVMGLFDGGREEGGIGIGSTADIASFLEWPILMVADTAGMGQSIGALLDGYDNFHEDISVDAVILNNVASPRHAEILEQGMEATGIDILGIIPRDTNLSLPSRHLGLVQAIEQNKLEDLIEHMANYVEENCDLAEIFDLAEPIPHFQLAKESTIQPLGQKIAVAKDEAFGFAYEHILNYWRQAGAEIKPFSPLNNQAPNRNTDAIFLPGGYPELYAGKIAAADKFIKGLKTAADKGSKIYGECGGYMVLGNGIIDEKGKRHKMAGLLGLETSFKEKKLQLGYHDLVALDDFAAGNKGDALRAHEFRYSTIVKESKKDKPLFYLENSETTCGLKRGSVSGSFMHLIDINDEFDEEVFEV